MSYYNPLALFCNSAVVQNNGGGLAYTATACPEAMER